MPLINTFLARWADGFVEVKNQPSIDLYGRKEGFISLADVQSQAEAAAVCRKLFESMAEPQISTVMAIEPSGVDDMPYTHFRKGDYIDAPGYEGGILSQRVRALTTSVDEDGKVIFVPEMRSIVQEEAERIQRWLKRMANGAVGGTTNAPSPTTGGGAPTFSPIAQGELPPFTYPGPVAEDLSAVYRPVRATKLTRIAMSLRQSGSGTTTVSLLINGVSVTTLSLAALEIYKFKTINVNVTTGTTVQVSTTAVGASAEDLLVQVTTSG